MLCISACSKGAYEGISMLCNAMLCMLSQGSPECSKDWWIKEYLLGVVAKRSTNAYTTRYCTTNAYTST